VEGFFAKKFQVREKIPLSALAFGCSHALVAEGFNPAFPGSRTVLSSSRADSDIRVSALYYRIEGNHGSPDG
jgi:hypothetical protein